MTAGSAEARVLALSGGVGGAKLALGLAAVMAPGDLHVVVNTGDDFRHLGLHICPDIDTLLYTLSGRSNSQLGWGLEEESWNTLNALEALGGDTWFRLGDRDLATHLWRTAKLASGLSLSELTQQLARRLGVASHIHPMSDDPVRTLIQCDEGELPFQDYFVRRRCEPQVTRIDFAGIETARPNPAVMALLREKGLQQVILCPSNPFVSVDPILQLPQLWQSLRDASVPVVAVSPIVAGAAIKGPAGKMMQELGVPVSAAGVAARYQRLYPGLVTHFVIDDADAEHEAMIRDSGLAVTVTATVMQTAEDKRRLAHAVLNLVEH